MHCRPLVFTDLDGTLLDHHDYGFEPARAQLIALQRADIPVIPTTSKTRAELIALRRRLDNGHPFIVENGAAVFIPRDYFSSRPADTVERDDFWVYEASLPRSHWLALLADLEPLFAGEFLTFQQAGVEGIASMTGLDPQAAELAGRREYSEPLRWLGSEARKAEFQRALADLGGRALQGGRFLAVGGDCDKGRALRWLASVYAAQPGIECVSTLAAGDSGNDVAMLEAADRALLVRSPAHGFPVVDRSSGVIRSRATGPAGWAEGVAQWLASGCPGDNDNRG